MTIADRPSRALRAAVLAAAFACALVLVIGVSAARAAASHPTETSSFGPDGTAASEFSEIGGIDFNQANGHLFVAGNKPGESRQIFGYAVNSPTARTPLGGAFPINSPEGGSSLAVGDGTGDIYLAGSNSVYGYKENGELVSSRFPLQTPPSPFGPAYLCRVTTDGSANLWVTDYEPNEMVEFTPTGAEIRGLHIGGNEFQGSYCAIAFDHKNGDMFVSKEGGPVRRFTAASDYTRSVEVWPEAARNLAVNSETGIVYATVQHFSPYENAVVAFRENGAPIEKFAKAEPEINGITVDEANDSVYLTRFGKVHVYAAGPIIADVATGPVTAATGTSATVSATVNTAGGPGITSCSFDYGETTSYELGSVPCDQGNVNGEATVTATLNNLQSGRTYHYRIDVTNGNGKTSVGADRLASVAGPPTIEGLFATEVTANSANLNARINPRGAATTYRFEYGTTVAYGSEAPIGGGAAGAGQDPQTVVTSLSGLGPGTYHFRVVATNSFGTVVSADQTFGFEPPDCPNAHLRQQTGGSYLPDCRAYELVSPGNAGGIIMIPDGAPDAPYATNPTRYPFGAVLGAIPGTEPTNATGGDTYVATRTDNGWVTSYTGLKGSETLDQGGLVGDIGFDRIIDFHGHQEFGGVPQPDNELPYVWDARGTFIERWPNSSSSIPGSNESSGAYQPSPDFSHFAFSSNNISFAPNGRTEAPGSAYDYDVAEHSTKLISLLPNGQPIPQNPTSYDPHEFILFPGDEAVPDPTLGYVVRSQPIQDHPSVSTDGSHILMSTSEGGYSTGLVKLYERVNDAVTYLVSKNHAVHYDGMTADGTRVYFDTTEQLLPQDTDKSSDLYMWSEATDSLTILSQGVGTGDSDSCTVSWVANCGIEVVQRGRSSDYPIATESGDIYFYSPELLAGPNSGVPGKRNLYVSRNGSIHFVAALGTGNNEESASRIQVSPNGLHMAFLTTTRVGSYDNSGLTEMYTFEPQTGKLTCVSCLPSGESPTDNVEASLNGLFMSNDGRTFFYTADPLVPRDTDGIHDVYEYTEGQAQLISTGTGAADKTLQLGNEHPAGLEGVSADGVNVYFITYENLVPQDENGQFLKFYDARVNGGFEFTPPPTACEAADECHGEGSAAPTPAQVVSENGLGNGGNFHHKHKKHKKHKKHSKHKKKHGKKTATAHGKNSRAKHSQARGGGR